MHSLSSSIPTPRKTVTVPWKGLYTVCLRMKILCIRTARLARSIKRAILWQLQQPTATATVLSWPIQKRREWCTTTRPVRSKKLPGTTAHRRTVSVKMQSRSRKKTMQWSTTSMTPAGQWMTTQMTKKNTLSPAARSACMTPTRRTTATVGLVDR